MARKTMLLMCVLTSVLPLLRGGDGADLVVQGKQPVEVSPYKILSIREDAVTGVKVDDQERIYLKLSPEAAGKKLIIRLSNFEGSGYRPWDDGSMEFVAPADRGRVPEEWSDWVVTTAPYIEYWIDGELALHLHRVE